MQSSIYRCVRLQLLALLITVSLSLCRHAVAQIYTVTNLRDLGGGSSTPQAINNSGQVVGGSLTANGDVHAFLWQNGVMIDLETLGGDYSYAYGINDAEQVVGYSYIDLADASSPAFLWQNGSMTDLGTLSGQDSTAYGINNSGQVVGYSEVYLADAEYHAFLWQNGTMTDLGTLNGYGSSYATGINNAGQIVGFSYLADGATIHAFLWQNGVMTDLGTLGGDDSYTNGINDAGQVVGYSYLADVVGYHAFLWQNGVMTDLGTLGGEDSDAYGINAAGQVVGVSELADGSYHAFLWQNGVMTDLNDLISAGSGWVLEEAYGINDAGQIICVNNNGGIDVAFLLTPEPTANPQTVAVLHGTPTAITLTGTDYENPPPALTFAIAAQPANGKLTDLNTSTGAVTYTPTTKFQGTDSFTFTVNNGTNTSAAATVTLNVAAGTPTANAQTFVVPHNTVGDITLTGTDPDVPALALAFTIVAKPANGTLGVLNKTTGAVTYTPKASYQGTDTFTFSVSNGTNTSAAATVTLKVASGVPTGNAQTVAVAHSTAIKITLTGSDPDVPVLPLTFELATIPAHGVLGALNASTGVVTYTPDSNYDGTDSFTFTVDNGTNTSVAAKVTLNVAAGTPTANAQTVAVAHGTAKSITLTGTDPDSPALPLTFAIVGKPAHGVLGTLNATTGVVEYTPTSTYSGTDSFTFTAGNKTNISAAATVTLNVAAGTPKANAQTVAVAHNTATSITLTGTDPDVPALALTYAIVAKPTNGTLGTLDKATGAVTYTPKASFQGTDTFTFTVNNGTNTSAAATVTLKVAPGTPTANAQTVTVVLNTAIKITLTGTDPDVPALPLTFAIVTKPLHGVLGSVNASTGVVTYTPDSKYDGTDTFTFTVSNGTNKSAAATVTLKVGGG